MDSIFVERILRATASLYLITGVSRLRAYRLFLYFYLQPMSNRFYARFSHSSCGKIARSRRLLSLLSTFTPDRYVNDITTSVEIAHFVIQVGKTDSRLNEIRVGINNKENTFALPCQLVGRKIRRKIDRSKDELIIINYKYIQCLLLYYLCDWSEIDLYLYIFF